MKFWITKDGMYYESEFKIQKTDVPVSKRPNSGCSYINGVWVYPTDTDTYPEIPDKVSCCEDHRISSHIEKKESNIVLNENTKLLFGIKDIVMIAAFIITATISWQDTNTRISKLEDNKVIEQIESKLKTLEFDLKALDKQNKDAQLKIEQNIRELEQVIFMRNVNRIK